MFFFVFLQNINIINIMGNMLRKTITFILLCLSCTVAGAQAVFTMSNGDTILVNVCDNPSGTICDDGGLSDSYSNNFSGYVVLTATPGVDITISGSYHTESCCDRLRFYDGHGTYSSTLLGEVRGSGALSFTASSGVMTIHFSTDYSVTYEGFELTYSISGVSSVCSNLPSNLVVSGVTQSSAHVSWSAPNSSGPFVISLSGGTPVTVNGNSYTFNSLSPGSVYNLVLSSMADSASHCCRVKKVFRTSCNIITHNDLPYHYGFEDATGSGTGASIDTCWTRISNSALSAPSPTSADANTGSYSMNLVSSSGVMRSFLVMPEYVDTISVLCVRFAMCNRAPGGEAKVSVGVMTDPFDTSTFVNVESVRNTSNEFVSKMVPLLNYMGSGHYVAFRVRGGASDILLDDVVLERISNCSSVNNMHIENVSSTSLAVSWSILSLGTNTTVGYEVEAVPMGGGATVNTTVSRSPAIVTGLEPNTTYRVRVRALCTNNNYGNWDSVDVTTRCQGFHYSSPSGTGTENVTGVPVNSAWGNTVCQSIYTAAELRSMGMLAGPISSIQYTWTMSNDYDKTFDIYMGATSQSSYSGYATFLTAGTHVYSGNHPIGTNGPIRYALSTPFVWDGVSNLVVTTIMNQPAGAIHYSSGFNGMSTYCNTYRTAYTYRDANAYSWSDLPSLTGNGTSYRPNIVMSTCDTNTTHCIGPMLVVDSIGFKDAFVSWAPGNTETEWEVAYRLASSASWTVVATHYTGTTFHFTGLARSTEYVFRVTSQCGSATASSTIQAMTRCRQTTFNYDDLYAPNVVCRSGGYSNPDMTEGVVDFGNQSNLSRHTVHNDRSETDFYTGHQLHTVPEGYCTSVRLGNSSTGSQAESITYTFNVDTADYDMLLLKYAAVLEDPNHSPEEQPRFTFLITDVNGDTISPCYNADFIANANLGWNTGSNYEVLWKDWTTVGVDLSPMHGQVIRIKLTSYDCDQGGHFGYAYFVIDLDNKALRSNSCNAIENTFFAPSGFAYSWYGSQDPGTILSTVDSLHVTSEGTYYCDLSFVGAPNDDAHSNCFFTMMAHSGVRYPYARFTPVLIDTASCRYSWMRMVNQSIVTRDSAHLDSMANGCESYLWEFDDGSTSGDVNPRHAFTPGLHTVTLYAMLADGQCADTVTHTFLIESPCMRSDTFNVTLCEGDVYHVFDTALAMPGEYLLDSIGADDSLFLRTVFLSVNPRSFDTVVQTVCGGYLWPQSGTRYTLTGHYSDTLVNSVGCDSIVTLDLTVYPVYDTNIYDTVCQTALDAGYSWGGTVIHAADIPTGVLTDNLHTSSPLLCDSVVTLHLDILPVVYGDTFAVACDSFAWYGTVYNNGSTITDTLLSHYTSPSGCDSAVVLHLSLRSSTQFTYFDTCSENGLPRYFHGITVYGDTVATVVETNAAGCDSIITYHLTVLGNSHAVFDTTLCENQLPIQWFHRIFTEPGTQLDTISNHLGADSTLTLTLHTIPVSADTVVAAVCPGQSYTFEGVAYSDSGLYTHTLLSSQGCDSLRTLHLGINSVSFGDTFAIACDNFTWHDSVYTASTFNSQFSTFNSQGCDSTVTLHLTINNSTTAVETVTACDSYTWHGTTYTASTLNSQFSTLNSVGCDSIVTLHLTVNYSTSSIETDTACNSYTWHDSTYTASTLNSQYSTLNSAGCDSTVTLHLTVFYNSTSTVYDTIVENNASTWQYHGIAVAHDTAGMQVVIPDHHGCDSVISYNLHVWPNVAYSYDTSICANAVGSFNWHGQPYADTLHWQLPTVHGADSHVTLAVHLLPVYNIDIYDTLCRNVLEDGYAWGDTVIHYDNVDTVAHIRYLLTQSGCDSTVTLHLVIHPDYNLPFYDTVYYGDTVFFEGMVCTEPGVYVNRHETAEGCDSLHTLYLAGRNMVAVSRTDTICQGDTLFFGHHVITGSGTFTDTIVSGDFAIADTLLTLSVVEVPYPVVGFDTAVVCGSDAHYTVTAVTDAPYLRWSSSPRDPSLDGQEYASVIQVSPAVPTLYTLEADYRSRPQCRVSDTLRIAPVDNIAAVIEIRPPFITLDDRSLTAYNRSQGHYTAYRWYVLYDENAPIAVDEAVLSLTVPHSVDSVAIALSVANLHCADTDTVNIDILHSGILFPNVFTPSKETNNIFRCMSTNVHNFELWIYDRRGALLFHTTDINEGWDGTVDGRPCRQETYVFRCRYSNEEVPDGYQSYTGTVTLIR